MDQLEDVEVILAHDRHYKFHSGVLARNSTLLAKMLTERNGANLRKSAKEAGVKIRWMIALERLPSDEEPAGSLEWIQLDNKGQPLCTVHALVVNENGRVPTKAFDYYESIFYAFYNKEIKIDDEDMHTALTDALAILEIAEYMGCIPVIAKPIDVALIKHGQDLFRSIQQMPWSWVGLGIKIKSELIFREAIVHLAGNWRKVKCNKTAMDRLALHPKVEHIVEKHHRLLIAKGRRLELAVASLYPGGIGTPSQDLPVKREEYAKDILVWIALCFFRHWLSQRIISEKGSAAPDGGYELYKQLGDAGEAYMDKTVINQFHGKFPMTKKAMNVCENHLLEIKECVKEVVRRHGVLGRECQLDIARYHVDYLTCAVVTKDDFPWKKEPGMDARTKHGIKRGLRPGGNEIVKRNMAAAKLQARAQTLEEQTEEDEVEDDEEDQEDEEDDEEEGDYDGGGKRAKAA